MAGRLLWDVVSILVQESNTGDFSAHMSQQEQHEVVRDRRHSERRSFTLE